MDLVYIIGAHRSGATILGTILGSRPGTFFVGELYRFPAPIVRSQDRERTCSCGAPILDCPFWSRVCAEGGDEGQLLARLHLGQRRFERWSKLFSTISRLRRNDPALASHVTDMIEFLRVIAHDAGASTIVESSYNPLRGRLYAHVPAASVRVRYIHLVRDGRRFLASELASPKTRDGPRPWVRAAPVVVARWVFFNLFSLWLCAGSRDRYLRVRYEDLVRSPEATLLRLQEFLGWDLQEVGRRLVAGGSIPMRHIAAGNRVRLKGELALRPELSDPVPLPFLATAMFWTMAGWLALALGYPLRGPGASGSSRNGVGRGPPEPAPRF